MSTEVKERCPRCGHDTLALTGVVIKPPQRIVQRNMRQEDEYVDTHWEDRYGCACTYTNCGWLGSLTKKEVEG